MASRFKNVGCLERAVPVVAVVNAVASRVRSNPLPRSPEIRRLQGWNFHSVVGLALVGGPSRSCWGCVCLRHHGVSEPCVSGKKLTLRVTRLPILN